MSDPTGAEGQEPTEKQKTLAAECPECEPGTIFEGEVVVHAPRKSTWEVREAIDGGDPSGGTIRAAPKPPSFGESVVNDFSRATNPIYASIDFGNDINHAFLGFGRAAALDTQEDKVRAALRVFTAPLAIACPALLAETRVLQAANVAKEGSISELLLSSLKPTHYITKSERVMKDFVKTVKSDGGINESILFVEYNGSKFIVDGHHRFFAAQKLGIKNVPVQQVQLPFRGYQTTSDLILSGKQPGWWKFYKP